MDEEEYCYCHYHDDTYEYFDCLDYMECEECPYYYADEDQVVKQMNTTEEYKGCRNYKYQPEPMQTCDWIKHQNEVYRVCPMWELKENKGNGE